MAEYIDREPLIEHYQMILEDMTGDERCIDLAKDIEISLDNLKNEPIADVIERSKIDKAISEISEYASIWTSYTMDMSKEQIAERCLDDCKKQFLEILKRNIGE